MRMKIDENKEFVLTNYARVRIDGKATDSDHNTQYMDLDLEIENFKPKRTEIFNFKNKKSQEKFKQLTSETDKFTNCFQTNAPLQMQIENWRELLRSVSVEAFPKIRIRKRRNEKINNEVSKLIKLRNHMLTIEEKTELEEKISKIEAEVNRKKILKNFKYLSENPENIQMSKMWKLLKKIGLSIIPKLQQRKTIKEKLFQIQEL